MQNQLRVNFITSSNNFITPFCIGNILFFFSVSFMESLHSIASSSSYYFLFYYLFPQHLNIIFHSVCISITFSSSSNQISFIHFRVYFCERIDRFRNYSPGVLTVYFERPYKCLIKKINWKKKFFGAKSFEKILNKF